MRRDSRTLVFLLPESCRRSPTPHPSLSDGVMELWAPLRSAEASDPTYSPCPPQEHLRRPRLVRLGSRQTSSLLAGGGTRSNTGVRHWFKWKEFGQLISAVSPVWHWLAFHRLHLLNGGGRCVFLNSSLDRFRTRRLAVTNVFQSPYIFFFFCVCNQQQILGSKMFDLRDENCGLCSKKQAMQHLLVIVCLIWLAKKKEF